jgi:hypothetical protein
MEQGANDDVVAGRASASNLLAGISTDLAYDDRKSNRAHEMPVL